MVETHYLTVEQAAEQLQTSDEMIRRMLRDGRLRGRRLGGRRAGWRLEAGEIERFMQADADPSRPGPRPRRAATAPPSRLDRRLDLAHARAEAQWARRDGNEAEAVRWERIAERIATDVAAERVE